MVNFYRELELNQKDSPDVLASKIKQEKKKWTLRLNAPNLEKRQIAERKIELLNDAAKNLCDKNAKKIYDKRLASAEKKGQVEEAPAPVAEVYETEQTSVQPEKRKSEAYIQAYNMYEEGDVNGAIELCKRAVASGNGDAELYMLMAMSYMQNGDVRGTVATCRTGRELYPAEIGFLDILAELELSVRQDYTAAAKYVREMLALDPYYVSALTKRVQLDLINGNETKAEHDVEEYLRQNPYDDEYRLGAANAYAAIANSFLSVHSSGREYFENQEAYDKCLKYMDKAYEIYKVQNFKKSAEKIRKLGEKKKEIPMLIAYWILGCIPASIIGAIVSALPFVSQDFSSLLIFVLIIVFGWKISSKKKKPEWKLEMEEITGKRSLLGKFVYWYWGYCKMIFSPTGIIAGLGLALGVMGWSMKDRDD